MVAAQRVKFGSRFEVKASDTYTYADVNGDKKADFSIHLDDAVTLSKGYFIL